VSCPNQRFRLPATRYGRARRRPISG
jgi:hypothetical protein